MQLLRSHASSFSNLLPGAKSAAEECEREVEQEQEMEKLIEKEVQLIACVPRKETDWNTWQEALQSGTLQEFVHRASTEVRSYPKLLVHAMYVCHLWLTFITSVPHYEYAY